MKCKRCGAEINNHAKFCENCGARVNQGQADDADNISPVNQSGYNPGAEELAAEQTKQFADGGRVRRAGKENTGDDSDAPDGKKGGSTAVIVLLCILIGIMLFVAAAIGSYMFIDNHSSTLKDSYDEQNATLIPVTPFPEKTEAPTEMPVNKPTEKPTQRPSADADAEHLKEPVYKVFSDTEMGFSCAYPTHFEKYNDNTNEGRYTLRSKDASVSLRICAEDNSAGITLAQSMSMFKTKNPGEIEYSKTGNTYYAIRINNNGICRYRYLVSKNDKMYWFDFNYPEEYRDIYEGYIDHIYRSFTIR